MSSQLVITHRRESSFIGNLEDFFPPVERANSQNRSQNRSQEQNRGSSAQNRRSKHN